MNSMGESSGSHRPSDPVQTHPSLLITPLIRWAGFRGVFYPITRKAVKNQKRKVFPSRYKILRTLTAWNNGFIAP